MMNTSGKKPRGVHLVGSVPLKNAEEVFRMASSILGDRLSRLPDGETGEQRLIFIRGFQGPVFADHPQLELAPNPESDNYVPVPQYRMKAGIKASEVVFKRLGYAEAAIASYALFSRLKQEGVIPRACRFLVCLPPPSAPVNMFIVPDQQEAIEPAYAKGIFAELNQVANAVPQRELAIQWDVTRETGIYEGVFKLRRTTSLQEARKAVIALLAELSGHVPTEVEVGYHLCYGDYEGRHWKEPVDTAILVEIMNGITSASPRPINWFHIPVPRNRTDDAYFTPLHKLELRPETHLYLGLVHHADGVKGTRQRIEAAQKAISDFGVSTECGFGRQPPEHVPELLRIHAEVAGPEA